MKKILHYIYYFPNLFLLTLAKVKSTPSKIYGFLVVFNSGKLTFGSNVRINSSPYANIIGGTTRTTFVIKANATLVVGNFVSISNSSFYCTSSITIEDYVMIGGNCKIWDTDFHPLDPAIRKQTPNEFFKSKPIHIKESAFIGGSSIILKGVTIGKNSIVGAGSVVSKDIPDNEIWAGNPAKFIKVLK